MPRNDFVAAVPERTSASTRQAHSGGPATAPRSSPGRGARQSLAFQIHLGPCTLTKANILRRGFAELARLGDPQTHALRLDALASAGWERNVTDPDS